MNSSKNHRKRRISCGRGSWCQSSRNGKRDAEKDGRTSRRRYREEMKKEMKEEMKEGKNKKTKTDEESLLLYQRKGQQRNQRTGKDYECIRKQKDKKKNQTEKEIFVQKPSSREEGLKWEGNKDRNSFPSTTDLMRLILFLCFSLARLYLWSKSWYCDSLSCTCFFNTIICFLSPKMTSSLFLSGDEDEQMLLRLQLLLLLSSTSFEDDEEQGEGDGADVTVFLAWESSLLSLEWFTKSVVEEELKTPVSVPESPGLFVARRWWWGEEDLWGTSTSLSLDSSLLDCLEWWGCSCSCWLRLIFSSDVFLLLLLSLIWCWNWVTGDLICFNCWCSLLKRSKMLTMSDNLAESVWFSCSKSCMASSRSSMIWRLSAVTFAQFLHPLPVLVWLLLLLLLLMPLILVLEAKGWTGCTCFFLK